jgi:hypothetical protein
MDDHLGIGLGRESVPLGFEGWTDFSEVVDFTIEDDGNRPGLVEDRLLPAGEIDDAEPTISQRDRPLLESPLCVWPAMT